MIVRDKPNVWELIGVWRLSILPHIAPQLVSSVLWSCFIVWISTRLSWATRGVDDCTIHIARSGSLHILRFP